MPNKSIKICEKCESKIAFEKSHCPTCGHTKFRPEFIEKRLNVTGNFSVNVVSSFKDRSVKVLMLSKWFPGKPRWHININSEEEWIKISEIINENLGPLIGWKIKHSIEQVLDEAIKEPVKDKNNITAIAVKYPKLIIEILKVLDFKKIDEKNHRHILEILGSIAPVLEKSDESFQVSFKEIIKNLPKQGKAAIDQLNDLLKDWSLKQVTGVSQVVKERLNEVIRFEKAISKDETYEIKGNNSIHRILEKAMWIIDERYWLLFSNETLRKIIGDEIVKRNKKDEKKRPDFVCGSVGNKLIIVELKRPSHKLTINDLGQLELYLEIIESHSTDYKNFEAYLIGKSIDDSLIKRMKYRRSDIFKIRTFPDLIDDTKKRYKDYIDKLN